MRLAAANGARCTKTLIRTHAYKKKKQKKKTRTQRTGNRFSVDERFLYFLYFFFAQTESALSHRDARRKRVNGKGSKVSLSRAECGKLAIRRRRGGTRSHRIPGTRS